MRGKSRPTSRVMMPLFLVLICLLGVQPLPVVAKTVTDVRDRTVTVPESPQRVVALTGTDLDAALALGVRPVGTLNGRGQSGPPRYLGDRVAGIEVVGNFPDPNLGRIIELKPDLILAGGLPDRQLVGRLQKIAPTVVTYAIGEGWRGALERVARALGRPGEEKAFLERYREQVARTRGRLCAEADDTVSIVRWSAQGPAFMERDAFASEVVRDLGLRRPEAQREPGMAHSSPLSLEAMDRIDADWLFLGTLRPDGQASRALETMRERAVFQRLDAVRQERMAMVDGSLWTGLGGPIGALAVLDDVRDVMGGC